MTEYERQKKHRCVTIVHRCGHKSELTGLFSQAWRERTFIDACARVCERCRAKQPKPKDLFSCQ